MRKRNYNKAIRWLRKRKQSYKQSCYSRYER
nr:MAG TPA: hypothetical protein [Caudoviricetes sp.]